MPTGVYPRSPLAARFTGKTEPSGECVLWRGARRGGYGVMRVKGKLVQAHRVAYEITHGTLPSGTGVLHRCDEPLCVRAAHLFAGTQADNVADMIEKGRDRKARGEAHGRAKFSADLVTRIRTEHRQGVPTRTLSERYGVSLSYVWALTAGRKRTDG